MAEEIKRFIYVDSTGTVSYREVLNATQTDRYLQGYDLSGGVRTFLLARILEHDPADPEARVEHFKTQALSPVPLPQLGGAIEVCFTGFKAADKERLQQHAQNRGMFLRDAVAYGLHVLCYGYNAGPAKMEKARKLGVLILSEPQFLKFSETGEVPVEA